MIFPDLSRQGLGLAGACPAQTNDILAASASTVRFVMTVSPDSDGVQLERVAALIVPILFCLANISSPHRS